MARDRRVPASVGRSSTREMGFLESRTGHHLQWTNTPPDCGANRRGRHGFDVAWAGARRNESTRGTRDRIGARARVRAGSDPGPEWRGLSHAGLDRSNDLHGVLACQSFLDSGPARAPTPAPRAGVARALAPVRTRSVCV